MSTDTASTKFINMFAAFGFIIPISLPAVVIGLRKLYLRITKDKRPIKIFGGTQNTEESMDVKSKIQVNRYRMNNYNVEGNKQNFFIEKYNKSLEQPKVQDQLEKQKL